MNAAREVGVVGMVSGEGPPGRDYVRRVERNRGVVL